MGATKKAGLMTERRKALAKTLPTIPDGESSMDFAHGQEVAWIMKDKAGTTVGVSAIHRVFGGRMTYCQREIPPEPQRFAPLPSLNVCSKCERMYQRNAEREARLGVA